MVLFTVEFGIDEPIKNFELVGVSELFTEKVLRVYMLWTA